MMSARQPQIHAPRAPLARSFVICSPLLGAAADNQQLITDNCGAAAPDNRQRITNNCVTLDAAFSLMELMVVIAIITILMVLVIPAFTTMKSAGDITSAAYTIKGVLEQARTYAMANNTYAWVGFYEEDVSRSSTNPATPGTGRVVISIVASTDGTTVYNPNSSLNPDPIDPTRLSQVAKLVKIENVHIPIFKKYDSGTGNAFDTRPATAASLGRFGDLNAGTSSPSTDSKFPFQYPLGNPAPAAQYTFVKTLQFSPRGESRVNSTYDIRTEVEIGLQPTHGTLPDGNVLDANGKLVGNLVAVQTSGIGSNVKIYQR
jgi:prepilin-type N-terminal cleavage/methylation domain-containing protein